MAMSRKSLLVLLSFGLLCLALNGQTQRAFKTRPTCENRLSGLAKAMALGDKSCVNAQDKEAIKSFGLMHLLTPSGLHLSSALALFYFFPRLRFLTCLALLMGSFFTSGLYSLQRMLVFQAFNFKLKNVKMSFLVTMGASLLLGNFSQSPISFALSMLFWGTIVYHKGSKLNLALSLFLAQALVSIAFNQELNPLALIINPAVTFLFTIAFPVFLVLFPFGGIAHYLIAPFAALLNLLGPLQVLNVSGIIALLLALMLLKPGRKWALIMALFCLQPIQTGVKRSYQSRVSPLPSRHEFIKSKKRKAHFLDRSCSYDEHGRVICKKKPSRYGGPYL